VDIKSPEERSKNMSRIKNERTKPEMFIRTMLYRHGLRFRVNYSELPGKPDLYFIRQKAAVFIHGCYWHRHPGCKYAYTPKSNQEFWIPKLEGNRKRDEKVIKQLNEQGIRVLIIWECTVRAMLKNEKLRENVLCEILNFLNERNDVIMNI
jgi:DNA mismatch endonuclease (patch repair protein)